MTETATTLTLLWNTTVILFSGMLAYLNISQEPFTLFSILLMIDYITGLAKAKTLGHSITSNKMKYGLISKLSLLLVPVVIAIGVKAVGGDSHFVLLSGMYILIFSEVYSIIGNIYSIRTKDELPEYDAVAMIGKKIRQYLILKSGDKDV